ncbi:MAG: hypothetical protein P8M32_01505 [Phycisphaerales bacterium]|nr:hypothetical protein [Phycisphaerales bacterium]
MFTWTTRAAAAATILAASASSVLADTDSSTLDWPVGNHAWIGLNAGDLFNGVKEHTVVFDDIVSVNNAAWVRLHFGNTKLGRDSVLRVTSLRDGQVQDLDSATLSMWNNSSAYFNGNSVRVELIAGGLSANTLSIDTATWEMADPNRVGGCGICGVDDRVPSSDNRFARLMPTGCSATMYNADSCFVTAGHCLSSGDVLQFNVPASSNNCSTNAPPVADQFPITGLDGVDGGVGNDYGAIKAGTNSEGQTPFERYGDYVNIGSVPGSGNLTVNGYGVDEECVRSQVQQFCEGPLEDTDSETLYYNLDVTFGNSGSSILYNGEIVGVVTHCSESCLNYGTRIDKAAFVSTRDNVCAGGGGGGGCAADEIEDCNGNCCPADWVADGYCDDGTYTWNGVAIYLNCAEFNCDGGDCVCDGDPTGGCCVGTSCTVVTEAECGGEYLGDGSSCSGDPCGGSDPTGGCCIGTSCSVVTEAECVNGKGTYLGDNSNCAGNPCGGGGGGTGDTCGDAVAASEGGNAFDTTGNTDSGFGEPDESQCAGTYLEWAASPDFWFVWTPGSNGTASFTTCDTASYDTSMVLYEGTSCSNLYQIACSGDAVADGSCQVYHSQIDGIAVTAGQSYYIRLGGWQAATGAGTLTINSDVGQDEQGACCLGSICEVMTEVICNDSNGIYQGDNTNCEGVSCGPDLGACCVSSNCYQYSLVECTQQGGDWHGVGTPCTPELCDVGGDPTGACCVGTSCSVTTEANCGGDYLGNDTDCVGDPCGGGGGDDVSIAYSVSGIDRLSLDQPHFTIDVYAQMPSGWRLDAVAGNSDQQKTVACSTSFYQDGYGGPTSLDVNPAFFPTVPDLEWDSRVTIGALDSSGNPFPENALNQVGIDWNDFEAGGDLSAGNGVWFIVPSDAQGISQSFIADDCSEQNGVLIARLTAMDYDAEVLVEALFQGRDGGDNVWQAMTGGYITYSGELDCNLNGLPDACDIANGTSEDSNGNGIPDECDSTCSGDVDGDGDSDVDDILAIINGFGGQYDVDDLLNTIADFGCTG